MSQKYANLVEVVRAAKPLVHQITNYVTVNDCANITLAVGASPIMADAIEEVEDIAHICSALVLNMGTLSGGALDSMLAAGKAANEAGIPVILDPVAAGASELRRKASAQLLGNIKLAVLRGNISEVRFLAGLESEAKGVDASESDMQKTAEAAEAAKDLAQRFSCVVAITGAVDIVSDGKKTISIENGHPKLSEITGTGCMCSSLIGSFCAAAPHSPLEATVAALLCMGIAGEMAYEDVCGTGGKGNGSFRIALHDRVSGMTAETMAEKAKFYES